MNLSVLHKNFLPFLLTALLGLSVSYVTGQTPGLDVHNLTMLKNDTLHFQFYHYQIINKPKIKEQASPGAAKFNPASTSNGLNGIAGWEKLNHVYYVPPAGFIGRDTVVIEYYRQFGNPNSFSSVTAYKILNILVVPSYLTAENDYTSTIAGQPVVVNVLNNDIGNGTNLQVSEVTNANNGSAVLINGNTQVQFTPSPGYVGLAHLNYTICDAQGSCDMATVSICVEPAVQPAYDSIFITTEKNAEQVILFALDPNYTVSLPPANGALGTLPGVLTYIPNGNFVGMDKVKFFDAVNNRVRVFQIRVLDAGGSNVFLFDDIVFTPIGNEIEEIHVLANDNGSTYLQNVSLVGGTITNQGGQVTYLPNVGLGVYHYQPLAGFEGIDYFTYKATPPNSGAYEYAKCYIVVSNQNPAVPVFRLTVPKNTPIVLGDHLPIADYEYMNISPADLGTVTFYPGNASVNLPAPYGQGFSGYNMLVYKPNVNTTGSDEFELNYCPGGQTNNCPLVKVEIDIVDLPNPQSATLCAGRQCVWPGDANADGIVDIRDILPIGMCMGEVGEDRTNGSINWYAQHADNWNNLYAHLGYDVKHVDTDGNGIVASSDTTAIGQFYGKYNNLAPQPTPPILELPFYIEEPNFNSISPGDVLYAPIHLGNDSIPAMDAYGLTFGLDYDPGIFESVKVIFDEESWMSYNSPVLSKTHKPVAGKLDAGYTRTSGLSASGYGVIGVVEFIVIDDINGTRLNNNKTTINLRSFGMMNGGGQTFGLEGNSITLQLNLQEEGKAAGAVSESQLKVFPNPASHQVSVHLNGEGNLMERVVLYNALGSMVYDSGEKQAKRMNIDVSELVNGIYTMRVWAGGEMMTEKVEVVR